MALEGEYFKCEIKYMAFNKSAHLVTVAKYKVAKYRRMKELTNV
jgi:hypothetical protein